MWRSTFNVEFSTHVLRRVHFWGNWLIVKCMRLTQRSKPLLENKSNTLSIPCIHQSHGTRTENPALRHSGPYNTVIRRHWQKKGGKKSKGTGKSRDGNERARRNSLSLVGKRVEPQKNYVELRQARRGTKLIGGTTSNPRDKRRYGIGVERTPSSSTSKELQLRESDYIRDAFSCHVACGYTADQINQPGIKKKYWRRNDERWSDRNEEPRDFDRRKNCEVNTVSTQFPIEPWANSRGRIERRRKRKDI